MSEETNNLLKEEELGQLLLFYVTGFLTGLYNGKVGTRTQLESTLEYLTKEYLDEVKKAGLGDKVKKTTLTKINKFCLFIFDEYERLKVTKDDEAQV
jgi:hypothetical protein